MKASTNISLTEDEKRARTQQVDLLNKKSFDLRHDNTKKSLSLAQAAHREARELLYKKGEAYALLNKGFHEFVVSNYQEAFLMYNDALALFRHLDDKAGIAHTDYNIALIYMRTGDYDAAMDMQQQSYQLRKELRDEPGIASCKAQIGYLNGQFGLDDRALAEYTESLSIWRRLDNKAGIGNVLMSMGILFTKQDKLKQADEHLRESLAIRRSIGETNGVHGSANYLSEVLVRQGKYQEALDLLLPVLQEALEQEHPFVIGISRLRLSLARIYAALKDYPNTLKQLEEALRSATRYNQQYQLHDIYLALASFYKETADFEQALVYYEKFHQAKEAVINLNAATRLKNLEVINELKNREREIEIHLQKNSELKERNRIIREERKISESLLLNILPRQTARELKKSGKTKPRHYRLVTVLFTDFVRFTLASEQLPPDLLVHRLDAFFSAFDNIIVQYNIEKIKTIGDSYMAAGGIPVADDSNPGRVVHAALQIRDYVRQIADPLFTIRVGVHTGPLVAGVVGNKKFAYDVWGDTVNIASRMESSGEGGKVNISGATYELIKQEFECEYRGKVPAKNKGMIDMYFVHRAVRK